MTNGEPLADDGLINYERLHTLIEAFQFYPMIIKRDKNVSKSIHQIFNSSHKTEPPVSEVKDYLHHLLEIIWIKVQERHFTVAQAFRYFDIQNSGKVSKSDLIYGLEQLKVKLSSADVTSVFDFLDKNKDGFISYSEFCYLCEEKRRNIDPFDN